MNQSQKVLAAGTGLSGVSAACLIPKRGGEVVLYSGNAALREGGIKAKLDKEAEVNAVLEEIKRSDLLGVELCVISPGTLLDSPFVTVADDAKIPVLGEIELIYQCTMGKLAAVTRTNGKTTITTLAGEVLKAQYEGTFVVGNIGDPYTARVLDIAEESVTVAEVSSLQPEAIMDFHLDVNTIPNITPDHLNRHETMENHIHIKECVTLNRTEQDAVILSYDDPALRGFGQDPESKSRVTWFSSREKLANGFCMNGGNIIHRQRGRETVLVDAHNMKPLGRRNHENVMVAAAINLEVGISMTDIARAVKGFLPVEHRIGLVRECTGVRYYNGSKGIDLDAVIQALRTMPGPTILIAGGYDKNSDYDDWVSEFEGRVRCVVLIGQTRDKIAECTKKHKFTEIIYTEDMREAVQVYTVYVDTGNHVLSSPACASWGISKNYEEHGYVFKEYVVAL